MKNLIKCVYAESKKRLTEKLTELKKETTIESILSQWRFNDYIPASSKYKKWANVDELKAYLVIRINKSELKRLNNELKRIELINIANEDIESITISLNWVKSRMWGSNPNAEAKVSYKNGRCEYFNSGSISGCGYDKQSTAVANCLNQCNGLLKLLYTFKNKHIKAVNRELFGYGSGSSLFPHIEGGVGVSCYNAIFNKIGFEFKTLSSGKMYDVYTITKLKKSSKK